MDAEANGLKTIHAAVVEVERGLFHATYRTASPVPAALRLPPYQVGASARDVRARIESRAHALGYETIVWELAPVGFMVEAAEAAE